MWFRGCTRIRPGLLFAFILSSANSLAFSPADRGSTPHLTFELVNVERYLATDEILTSLPTPAVMGVERIIAFEDHEYFAYVYGTEPAILRRVIYLRPGQIVIDDQVDARITKEFDWTLVAPSNLKLDDDSIRAAAAGVHYRCQSLVPKTTTWDVGKMIGETQVVGPSGDKLAAWIRSIHIVSFAKESEPILPKCVVERQSDSVRLEIVNERGSATAGRTFRLWMPDGPASGRIEIVNGDGKKLVSNRLLPAGILAPDLGAAQRRLQWDLPYQSDAKAVWDTGHASTELKRMVESGQIKPCRAVEIGCGTGSDAVYLASQGFDVSAIDIAPTALNIAQRKAEVAGVKVNWLLADILNPPSLEPFDFVYDRGCYHEVRQHDPKAYVAAVEKLTHDGSKILILAGNANKDTYWRFEGPPRVKEQDIRQDFATGFRLLDLHDFRFDPAPPQKQGALAWSILLEREK